MTEENHVERMPIIEWMVLSLFSNIEKWVDYRQIREVFFNGRGFLMYPVLKFVCARTLVATYVCSTWCTGTNMNTVKYHNGRRQTKRSNSKSNRPLDRLSVRRQNPPQIRTSSFAKRINKFENQTDVQTNNKRSKSLSGCLARWSTNHQTPQVWWRLIGPFYLSFSLGKLPNIVLDMCILVILAKEVSAEGRSSDFSVPAIHMLLRHIIHFWVKSNLLRWIVKRHHLIYHHRTCSLLMNDRVCKTTIGCAPQQRRPHPPMTTIMRKQSFVKSTMLHLVDWRQFSFSLW